MNNLLAYDDADESHDQSKSFDADDKISDEETMEPSEPPVKKTKSLLSDVSDTPVGSDSGTPKKKLSLLVEYADDDNEITDEESQEEIEEEKIPDPTPENEIVTSPQPIEQPSENEEEKEKESETGVKLPPEPTAKCPEKVQLEFSKYHHEMLNGKNINDAYLKTKKLKNPSIYEKLLLFCKIDEKGSNFPKEIFDPDCWKESSYYDALSSAQRIEMDKREKEKKDRTKIEFTTVTKRDESKRKSKWDQSGSTAAIPSVPKPVQQARGTLGKKKTLQL